MGKGFLHSKYYKSYRELSNCIIVQHVSKGTVEVQVKSTHILYVTGPRKTIHREVPLFFNYRNNTISAFL